MADYIRREDALKLLSDDIPICGASLYQAGAKGGLQIAHGIVAAIPAADVAPVVRCKDCKYGDYDSKTDSTMVCLRTKDGFWRKETDFCSYGERKDDDEREP